MKRFSIHNQNTPSTNKKWLTALVPAIAFGALAVVLWREPVSTPITFNSTAIPSPVTVLPLSSTFVVGANSAAKPLTVRGLLTVSDPQIVAAPAGGMIARLLVQPGQIVKAGDTIAMISNQAVPAVEKSRIALQQHADAAQEAATRQQNILVGKLAQEKTLLKAANQRVNQAAKRLTDSRDLLRRLQNGEKISASSINNQDSDSNTNSTNSAPSSSSRPQSSTASAAVLKQAQQKADQTAKVAAQKWEVLHVLLMRQQAAKAGASNVNSNNAQSPAPTQDQIDSARADAKTAQDTADKARMKAFDLSATIPKVKPAASTNAPKGTFITEADAMRIANAALQESKDALAQVDAIQKQIQRYQSPVQSSTSNYQAATSNLESAQRSLFDNPPKVPMTSVTARSGGMVQTLATLAMQVNRGEEVASIVAPNLLNLNVRDSSGTWKKLKVNSKLTVNVQTSTDDKNIISTDARLISITPPTRSGQPSILHIQVFNPVAKAPRQPQAPTKNSINPAKPVAQARVFTPGMIAICSIPSNTALTIPRAALHVGANKLYQVAVLKGDVAQPQNYSIQWINVIVKDNDGSSANVVLSSGLTQGDRIALQPKMLYPLTVARGSLAMVQISKK
ncbi:MAG: hypothetical protein ABI210_03735 [Abditibacteriaceae bacterium]